MPRGAPLFTRWYDGHSPRAHAVLVRLDGDVLVIEPDNEFFRFLNQAGGGQ